MKNCSTCIHRICNPGSVHIGCNDPGDVQKASWPGCGSYPVKFDERIITKCERWTDNPADAKPRGNVAAVVSEIAPRLIDQHFSEGVSVDATRFQKGNDRRQFGPRRRPRIAR